jgi:hypothetical protein
MAGRTPRHLADVIDAVGFTECGACQRPEIDDCPVAPLDCVVHAADNAHARYLSRVVDAVRLIERGARHASEIESAAADPLTAWVSPSI